MTSSIRAYFGLAEQLGNNQNLAGPINRSNSQANMANNSGKWSLTDDDEGGTEGYDENFDPPVNSILECPICLLVLRNPVQTECGHRFCSKCIIKVVREGRKKCPIDNEDLEESQIYPDNFVKREILQLPVRCRNFNDHGCEWLGPLKDIKLHLAECEFAITQCTNGCGVKCLRKNLERHLKEECEKRIEACNYCNVKVVHRDMDAHCSTCPEFPVLCPNNCTEESMKRRFLDDHLKYQCPNAVVKCPFGVIGCGFEGPRMEVAKHTESMTMEHLGEFVQRFVALETKVSKEILPVKTLQKASPQQVTQKLVELQQQVSELVVSVHEAADKGSQGIQLAELYYSTQNSSINTLQDEIKVLSDRIEARDQTFTELQAKIWNGNFVWKITNFDKLFEQAVNGEVPAIHSLPFYSGIPGYKMCLRVNLNGVDSGASTHVSMFVHLMQGDFDSILTWPFPGKVTLAAIDQTEAEQFHVTETLVSRPGLQAFLRPRTPRNHKGYGYVEMISHTVLRTREYIKNNSMIVHVSVSLEN